MAKKVPVENSAKPLFSTRLDQIIHLASALKTSENESTISASSWGTQLDEIIRVANDIEKEIPDCKPALQEAERLTEEILDVILSLATLDFTKTVRVGYEDSNFNAVAAGLNMLGQELRRSVVSKQYVDNIISSMTDALMVVNPDQTLRTINEYTCTLLNYTPGELMGQPIKKLLNGDVDWLSAKNGFFKQGMLHQTNVMLKTKEGQKIPMQINASAMTDASGEPSGMVIVARDMRETLRLIKATEDAAAAERRKSLELEEARLKLELANTKLQEAHDNLEQQVTDRTQDLSKANVLLNLEIDERRRAEAEVSAREQKYRNIFETTSVSMWEQDFSLLVARIETLKAQGVVDFNTHLATHPEFVQEALDLIRIIDVNEASVRMFQADNKKHLIDNYRAIYIDDTLKTLESAIVSLALGTGDIDSETTARTLKGNRINIVMQLRIPPDANENIHASMGIIDISSQRELEQQLRQSQKMEAIGRLAGGVAHDFNNLLTVILNYGQMLVDDVAPGDPSRKKAEAVVDCAERAASLTQQLLAFSRRQMIEPKVVDVNSVLAKMEKMLQRLLGEDIELINHMSPDIGKVKADVSQLEQIIMNLAVNARDAMPHGGKLIIETQNVDLDHVFPGQHPGLEPGHYVMFAISDTGEGMSEAVRSKIFEPFFTTKGVGKGTGLGLSTVYGNVKQSGGHIWVYSEVGHGSTFKIYLPRLLEEDAKISLEPQVSNAMDRGSETILIVEDEDSVLGVASALLKRHGYHVLEARNAGEALLICEQHPQKIHLMLTDVIMPNMNGRALADRLAPNRPDMKVLFMSGYTDNAINQNGILEAGTAFLQKPFVPKTLLGKVREVLDTSSTTSQA